MSTHNPTAASFWSSRVGVGSAMLVNIYIERRSHLMDDMNFDKRYRVRPSVFTMQKLLAA